MTKNWNIDFYDETGGIPLLLGVPIITGCDLLEQFGYMPLGEQAVYTVMTIGPGISPDTVPTFTNFGIDGRLFTTSP